MSDPYTEATRHARTGMSTLAKVFLVGGGLAVTALAALFIWFSFTIPMTLGNTPPPAPPAPPPPPVEASIKRAAEQAEAEAARRGQVRAAEEAAVAANLQQRESSRAPEQESVSEELSRAVNTVLESAFEDAGFSVEPVGTGVGLSFDIRSGKFSTRFELVSDPEMLDRVSRGEGRFADLWPDDATERAEARGKPLPEWVPVFPGVDRKNSLSLEIGDSALGMAVFLAEASGSDILLWYFRAADRMERAGADFSFRQLRANGQPGDMGRLAVGGGDRQVNVFVIEDGHGDSVLVLVYKG